ncbi:MAG: GntR family transcriptional regulator [Acuticoccus sp.]
MTASRKAPGVAGDAPPPVRSRNLVAQLTDHMRHRILSGAFEAGERLNIRSLSDGYGISVTPMREALAKLNAEGLVSFRENAGYRVKEAPTDAEYALWSQARIAIETRAVELAKPALIAARLPDLIAANEMIASGDDGVDRTAIDRFSDANWTFHQTLVGLCDNPFMIRAHETLYVGRRFSQVFLGRGVVDRRRIVAEHSAIVEALSRADQAGAVAALTSHIEDSMLRDRSLAAKSAASDD